MSDEKYPENVILTTLNVEPSIVKVELLDDGHKGVILKFKNTNIKLEGKHPQDCCEDVYADFSVLKDHIPQLVDEYKSLIIKAVPEIGILLHFVNNCSSPYYDKKIFIPCYNEQNGYYSDELNLCITQENKTERIDITKYKLDKID